MTARHTLISRSRITRVTEISFEDDTGGMTKSINSHSNAYNTTGMYLIKVIVQLALHEVVVVLARRDGGCHSRVRRGAITAHRDH